MSPPSQSRYRRVSRRALLRASLGAGVAAAIPGLACGNNDVEILAGATTDPVADPTATAAPPSTAAPAAVPPTATEPPAVAEPAGQTDVTTEPGPTEPPLIPTATVEPAAQPTAQASGSSDIAVSGELVIAFTYTQAAGGKNEAPYVAVWVEDAEGELVQTVSLWYQQRRRGERWLDHLSRWFAEDAERMARGGIDNAATISSATRQAGSYAVAWDGTIEGTPAPAGEYFLCIESAREDGPYSLIREPFMLTGSLAESPLADSGELSAASVRIDG